MAVGYGRLNLWEDLGMMSPEQADLAIKLLYERSIPKWNTSDAAITGEYPVGRPVDSETTGIRYVLKTGGTATVDPDGDTEFVHWDPVGFVGNGDAVSNGKAFSSNFDAADVHKETPTVAEAKARALAVNATAGSTFDYVTPFPIVIRYLVVADTPGTGIELVRITPILTEYTGSAAANLPDETTMAPGSRFVWNQNIPLARIHYLVDSNNELVQVEASSGSGLGNSVDLLTGRGTHTEMLATGNEYGIWVVTDNDANRGVWYLDPATGWDNT